VWAIPHLTSALRIRFPVEQLCASPASAASSAWIDGAQCCGHLQLNMQTMGCDAYSARRTSGCHAQGLRLLYIRRDRLPRWGDRRLRPMDNYRRAFRFMQIGSGNLSLLKGYEAAVDFHVRIGPERVERRIMGLASRLREGLDRIPEVTIHSPRHAELLTATTVWSLRGFAAAS